MLKKMIVVVVVSISCFISHAQAWTSRDTFWETMYLAVHVADWGQTRDIARQCGSGSYYETNPIIGRCPSKQRVNTYFLSTALLHIGMAQWLPKQYRRVFQAGTIGMQMNYVTNNARIGLSVNF